MRIPLYIEFEGKKVVIIGGGGVGTSRAKKFLQGGAEVFVYSLEFSEELKKLSRDGRVKLIQGDAFDENKLDEILKDAFLVVVAVGDLKVNDVVKKFSKKYNFLLNLANDAKSTEVVVPFEGEIEGIRFAVTTEGKSGIVAKLVRDKFQQLLEDDEQIFFLLKAMEFLKRYMKENEVPINIRMKMYFAVSSDENFLELVRNGKIDEAKEYSINFVKDYIEGKRQIDERAEVEF